MSNCVRFLHIGGTVAVAGGVKSKILTPGTLYTGSCFLPFIADYSVFSN